PDQNEIAVAIKQARGMRVVRREADDRLAALTRADVGGGQPLDLVLCRHCRKILVRWRAEDGDTDHDGMEDETQREIKDGPHHERDRVVAMPADRDRWRAGIGSVFERDAIIAGPREKGAEQYDRAEIAVRDEVRDRPSLHTDQHGMLERAPDIAAAIGRD